MPAITRSQTAFNADLANFDAMIQAFNHWDSQMPEILNVAHNLGLRVNHSDNSYMGEFAIRFHQWVQSKNPLAGARHLYPADVLNHITFFELRDYHPYTFEVYKK